MTKTFYICSYGGCGSKLLTSALSKYGNVEHVHSRIPPDNLEYVGNKKNIICYCEWFNGIKIPDDEVKDYFVIYIYRNPNKSIFSRFELDGHLTHIQCKDTNIKLSQFLDSGNDLYGIEEFYDNYTVPNKKRNYKIYCVKYEELFEKHKELSKLLGIGELSLTRRESRTIQDENKINKINEIYKNLTEKMNKNDFITLS